MDVGWEASSPDIVGRLREQLDATCLLVDQLRQELNERSNLVNTLQDELEDERLKAAKLEKQSKHRATVVKRDRSTGAYTLGGSGTSMDDKQLRQVADIARLDAELDSAKQMVRALQDDVHKKSGALRKLEKQLQSRVLRIGQLEEELEQHRQQLQRSGLDSQLDNCSHMHAPYQGSADQDVRTLYTELQRMHQLLKKTQCDLISRSSLVHTLEQQLRLELDTTNRLEEELEDKNKLLSLIQNDVEAKVATIADLQYTLDKLTSVLAELHLEVVVEPSSKDGPIVTVHQQTPSTEDVLSEHPASPVGQLNNNSENAGPGIQVDVLEELQRRDEQVALLKSEIIAKNTTIQLLREELKDMDSTVLTLQELVADRDEMLHNEQMAQQDLRNKVQASRNRVEELERRFSPVPGDATRTLQSVRQQIESLHTTLIDRSEGMGQGNSTSQQRSNTLEEELKVTQREIRCLRDRLHAVVKSRGNSHTSSVSSSRGSSFSSDKGGHHEIVPLSRCSSMPSDPSFASFSGSISSGSMSIRSTASSLSSTSISNLHALEGDSDVKMTAKAPRPTSLPPLRSPPQHTSRPHTPRLQSERL